MILLEIFVVSPVVLRAQMEQNGSEVCLSACLSVCLSISPSIYLSVYWIPGKLVGILIHIQEALIQNADSRAWRELLSCTDDAFMA